MFALAVTFAAFLYFAGIVQLMVQDFRDLALDPLNVLPWRFEWRYLAWPLRAFSDAWDYRNRILKVLKRGIA